MAKPVGVILAGGQSRRMGGGDKWQLDLVGRPLIAHVMERLAPQVQALAINANGDPSRIAHAGLAVIPDSVAGFPGPLGGILAALDWAAGRGARHVVTAAADTPFLPRDLAAALGMAMESDAAPVALAATPRDGGGFDRHPTFGRWDTGLREPLRQALADGVRKVVAFTDEHGAATAVFHAANDPFFNVNTPADLERARQLAGARRCA